MREVSFGDNAKRIFGNVILSRIINTKSGETVVHLTQEVKSIYPEKIVRFIPGLNDDSFNVYVKKRHCLVFVPTGLQKKEIISKLKLNEGHIYQIISYDLEDVITPIDYNLLKKGIPLYEIEDRYETKDKEGNTYSKGLMRMTCDGEILRDIPKEYRRYDYSKEYKEDIDLRNTN